MNETKQIKFPIAAVFCTLNVLLGFINIFMTYALLPRMPLDRLLVSLLLPGLSLISGIVLAVILYNRKRNLPLFLALGLELAICLFCIYGTVSEQSLMNSYWGRVRLFSQAITAVNALLFLVFAVSQDRKEESDMAKFSDVFYGFRPTVAKSNKNMFVCLTALSLVGIAQQTFMSYLINFITVTMGIEDYILPLGVVIVLSAVITGVLGVLYDKFGRKNFYIPVAAVTVAGTLAIYLAKFMGEGAYLPMLYVGGTIMLGAMLCTSGALMAAFQDYTPKGYEGRFQGVRMCFTVLLPMIIGPVISLMIGINSFDSNDSAITAPPFEIFLAASIVAALAIIPIVFVAKDADRLREQKSLGEQNDNSDIHENTQDNSSEN